MAPPKRSFFAGFSALGLRPYQFYTASAMLQGMAESMQMLANGWYAYYLTGSTAVLGLTLLAQAVPQTLLSFGGGVVADRFPRRTVWMVCVLLTAALSLWLAISVVLNTIIWQDLVIRAFLFGAILAFRMPARQGLMNDIAGREHIMSAVALQTMTNNSMMFVGPATAGVIIDGIGIGNAYFIITGFLIVAAVCQLFINPARRDTQATRNREPWMTSAKEGLSYLRRAPDVRTVLTFTLFGSALAMPYVQLLPAYAKEVLNLGPAKLGLLTSLAGVGSLVGAVGVTVARPKLRGLLFIQATLFMGVALAAFCLTSDFAIAGAIAVIVGVGQAYSGTLGFGLLNAYTEQAYLGRVFSIMLTQNGLGTLAGFVVALAAEAIGVRWAILATSTMLVAVSAAYWLSSKRLRSLV